MVALFNDEGAFLFEEDSEVFPTDLPIVDEKEEDDPSSGEKYKLHVGTDDEDVEDREQLLVAVGATERFLTHGDGVGGLVSMETGNSMTTVDDDEENGNG